MISSLFIEAALRSVLLALAVWLGLRVFSVRNVLAQKVAWGLVLASAVAMPVVLPMTEHWSVLPANVRVVIPADPETLLEELQARIQAKATPELTSSPVANSGERTTSPLETSTESEPEMEAKLTAQSNAILQTSMTASNDSRSVGLNRDSAPSAQPSLSTAQTSQPKPIPAWRRFTLLQFAGFAYLSVGILLCLRLLYGLLMALRVWRVARPLQLDASPLTDGLRLRVSDSISSPVTIGSVVVLPSNYREWDSEKLRIVLAHERSHIRQGDFYLQLLAGLYAATVWFSPLGWWLKRKLSDLAEAISDRAGLEEAADRASYAQILLEFAAAPRPTLIGVAMARHGSISRRIERLLNDVSFRQAFAGTRRALIAVIVIPVALFAATTLVRVQAAGQQAPAPPAAPSAVPEVPAAPAVPDQGVSNPEQIAEPPAAAVAPQAAADNGTPKPAESRAGEGFVAPPSPGTPSAPAHSPVPPAHAPAVHGVAPATPAHAPAVVVLNGQPGIATLAASPGVSLRTPIVVVPRVAYSPAHATLAIVAPSPSGFGEGYGYGVGQSPSNESGMVIASNNGGKSGYRYWFSNGESYAVVRGNEKLMFSGDWIEGRREAIDKARAQAHGDFLWFTRDGKSYFVDDPATLAQIEAMHQPIDDLGRQQNELGKKQEALGKQQEELGKQQEAASVPTPDMSKEIAKIDEAMAKLKASQGKNMTQDQFAELQEKLGELQGEIGELQGQIGSKQQGIGARMGELGARMAVLGAKQGELGEQQGRLWEQVDRKVKSIIDESLKNGKAKPVQ